MILRVSGFITFLKILLIYYIKFFNFGVIFSVFLFFIKIPGINFDYFTMDKNIKDYITGMYNFLYVLPIDDSVPCMAGNELLSKVVISHNTFHQNLWYMNFIFHLNKSDDSLSAVQWMRCIIDYIYHIIDYHALIFILLNTDFHSTYKKMCDSMINSYQIYTGIRLPNDFNRFLFYTIPLCTGTVHFDSFKNKDRAYYILQCLPGSHSMMSVRISGFMNNADILRDTGLLYSEEYSDGICKSIRLSLLCCSLFHYGQGFDNDSELIVITDYIHEFDSIYIYIKGRYVGTYRYWWDLNNRKVRLDAFDKLIKLYTQDRY